MNTNTNAIDDLARSVSQSLSLGSSVLVNFNKLTSVVVLPHNYLHPGLYNNSMNECNQIMLELQAFLTFLIVGRENHQVNDNVRIVNENARQA
jgi:hypothetical protein